MVWAIGSGQVKQYQYPTESTKVALVTMVGPVIVDQSSTIQLDIAVKISAIYESETSGLMGYSSG